jgi:TM2 domain-containing membrane protein YozV
MTSHFDALNQTSAPAPRYKSKTLAAWLALLLGTLGVHRLYLHGVRDVWAWLHPAPSLLGLVGVLRLRSLGQDDHVAWALIPFLGLMISLTMLTAIVYALTPDERWDARHNPQHPGAGTGWGPVLAAVAALLLGGGAFMGTVAYGGQKFFEWQLESEQAQNSSRLTP